MEEAYFRTAKALAEDAFSESKTSKELITKLSACEDVESFIDMTISSMRVRLDVNSYE